MIGRNLTYSIYLAIIIAPLLIATERQVRVFGALMLVVFLTTYFFFTFAYISVFCFGGAIMSLYLVYMILTDGADRGTPFGLRHDVTWRRPTTGWWVRGGCLKPSSFGVHPGFISPPLACSQR